MREPMRALWIAGAALVPGATTAIGALLGQYLDQRWGTGPWLTLAGTLLGMAIGFYELVWRWGRASGER